MTQTLNLTNYNDSNILQTTKLSAAVAKSSASLPAQNNLGFIAADFIIVGTPGSDTVELLTIQSLTGQTTITPTVTTKIDHPAYDYINKLFGNKIRIYRAANVTGIQPADSSFTPLDTIDIQPDRPLTQYTDPSGGSNYWYKFVYYNSTTDSETNLSDSNAVRGGSSGNYCSVEDIRVEAGFKFAPYVTDSMIDAKRQAAQDEINGALNQFYDTPFQPPINDFLKQICVRIAAGLLLQQQFSAVTTDSTANGKNKLDEARADLQKIVMKERVVTDENGSPLDLPGSSGGADGWPNSSTASAPASQGGAPRVFRMSDIVGRGTAADDSGNAGGNIYYGRKW